MRLRHQYIKGDITASICVLFYIALVYYISYTPFQQCISYDPKIAEHNIKYRSWYEYNLKCERAEEREILHTRPLNFKGVFGRLGDTVRLVAREKDVPYQDWFYMVYIGITLSLKWGLNAVMVALSLDCWLLAFTIFATWFIHGILYHARWPITWWVWFFSYGVLVSKLYGETFDLMVVLLSYAACIIFVVGLLLGIILSFFDRH